MTEPNKIFVRPLSFEGMFELFLKKKELIPRKAKNTNPLYS